MMLIRFPFTLSVLGGVDDGWLYVFITRTAPPRPSPSTFNVTVFEDQRMYQGIFSFSQLPAGAEYRITGEGNSDQFFGTINEVLHVIRPLIERPQGFNR